MERAGGVGFAGIGRTKDEGAPEEALPRLILRGGQFGVRHLFTSRKGIPAAGGRLTVDSPRVRPRSDVRPRSPVWPSCDGAPVTGPSVGLHRSPQLVAPELQRYPPRDGWQPFDAAAPMAASPSSS